MAQQAWRLPLPVLVPWGHELPSVSWGAHQGWAACRSRWGPVQLGGGCLVLEPVSDVEDSKCLQRATPSGSAVAWPPFT